MGAKIAGRKAGSRGSSAPLCSTKSSVPSVSATNERVRSQNALEVTGRSYRTDDSALLDLENSGAGGRELEPVNPERRWYALCTRSRHEKSVVGLLQHKEIETFLPLYATVRRWKNGDHRVQLPLLPGYTFVRISLINRLNVLKVPGVVRFVEFDGMPAAVDSMEIEHLRNALAAGIKAEPHPYLAVGRHVSITGGPLAGFSGVLLRRKGSLRVIISVSSVQRSIQVEIPTEYIAHR